MREIYMLSDEQLRALKEKLLSLESEEQAAEDAEPVTDQKEMEAAEQAQRPTVAKRVLAPNSYRATISLEEMAERLRRSGR